MLPMLMGPYVAENEVRIKGVTFLFVFHILICSLMLSNGESVLEDYSSLDFRMQGNEQPTSSVLDISMPVVLLFSNVQKGKMVNLSLGLGLRG